MTIKGLELNRMRIKSCGSGLDTNMLFLDPRVDTGPLQYGSSHL